MKNEKAYVYLEIDEVCLTDAARKAYAEQYDEDWMKEGYLITGDLKIEDIYIEKTGNPELTIQVYSENVYVGLTIPLDVFLAKLLKYDGLREIVRLMEKKRIEIEKIIEQVKELDNALKKRILLQLIEESIEVEDL